MSKVLTFELGTTLFKAALFDRDGRIVALERIGPPIAFRSVLKEAAGRLRAGAGGASAETGRLAFEAIVEEYARFLRYFKQQPILKQSEGVGRT